MTDAPRRIRVLVVDDSSLVRTVLVKGLSAHADLEVVGAARDPYEARDMLVEHRPDVLTLDVEMPRMDGVTFLRRFMPVIPTPTVVLSSLTTRGSRLALDALQAGAVEVVAKPSTGVKDGLEKMMATLVASLRTAARTRVNMTPFPVTSPLATEPQALHQSTDRVIGLGASTGGVAALGRVLPALPPWTPGVVVVQHMPAGFTAHFAKRMDEVCQMRASEAREGDRVLRGHILVAPGGNCHLTVQRHGGEYRVHLKEGPLVSGHIPSVDAFFRSLARAVGANATGVLMTGMGADGAAGLLEMRRAGARTYAQDRETSAVWGMPAAAAEMDAAERLVPLHEIPALLLAQGPSAAA